MTRMLLAALALACVLVTPALAGASRFPDGTGGAHALAVGLASLGVLAGAIGLAAMLIAWAAPRLPPMLIAFLACAVALVLPIAALAAEAAPTAIVLPWGDWLVALAHATVEIMLPIVIPLVAAYAIAAIRKVYPWAALVLTQRRVEAMIQSGASYGLNAVQGAAKGKTLSVPVGSAVIAAGGQYVIDGAPARVIKAAGGPEGIAKRIFRTLDLEEAASVENTLAPAVQRIAAQQR